MPQPITITATVAAWLPTSRMPHELLDAVRNGKHEQAVSMVWFYGGANQKGFSGNARIGTATVTLEMAPEDEQIAQSVQMLQTKLEEERAKWLTTQQAILEQINKLQAITFDAPAEAN